MKSFKITIWPIMEGVTQYAEKKGGGSVVELYPYKNNYLKTDEYNIYIHSFLLYH